MPSTLNDYVLDLCRASGLVVKQGSGTVRITLEGRTLGAAGTFAEAAQRALMLPESRGHMQALHFAAALSYGPIALFEAIDALWAEADDEDDSDAIHIRRA